MSPQCPGHRGTLQPVRQLFHSFSTESAPQFDVLEELTVLPPNLAHTVGDDQRHVARCQVQVLAPCIP
jgi:hypothetical protein